MQFAKNVGGDVTTYNTDELLSWLRENPSENFAWDEYQVLLGIRYLKLCLVIPDDYTDDDHGSKYRATTSGAYPQLKVFGRGERTVMERDFGVYRMFEYYGMSLIAWMAQPAAIALTQLDNLVYIRNEAIAKEAIAAKTLESDE